MQKILLLMAGGAFGTLARYLISTFANRLFENTFPLGTLAVNSVGSLLIGLLWGLFDSEQMSNSMRLFMFVGLLGGFTTFSAYSLDTMNLIKEGSMKLAVLNILANNTLAIFLVFVGFYMARFLK